MVDFKKFKTEQQVEDAKSHENFLKDIFADDRLTDPEKMTKIVIRLRNLDDRITSLSYDLECAQYDSSYNGEYW